MIDVLVNGEARSLRDPLTVAALVEEIGCGTKGVAVAVNEEVVPRSTWGDHVLRADDRVEVLNAVQGGC
jgi:sulfur carrier protein